MSAQLLTDTALSQDAERIRRLYLVASFPRSSVALGESKLRLENAIREAATSDWDRYGANAVSPTVAEFARSLLRALPVAWRQKADFYADPDGEMLFEWTVSPRWILTLAIDGRGTISYSGLYGESQQNGRELFDGELPCDVVRAISRVADHKK